MELTVEYHENTVLEGKNKGAIYAEFISPKVQHWQAHLILEHQHFPVYMFNDAEKAYIFGASAASLSVNLHLVSMHRYDEI